MQKWRVYGLTLVVLALTLIAEIKVADMGAVHAQETAQSAQGGAVFKAETRLVLVDTVVTDKKGNYVTDLQQKDFKVWEDDKEQPIKSFSSETTVGPTANDQPKYLVLFFDNSTMDAGDQIRARDAASKFIDANAGPKRLIALVDFGGTVRVAQNFTADADRLKKVVAGMRNSAVNPNAPIEVASLDTPPLGGSPALGGSSLYGAEADFGAHTVMLALRTMAKNLGSVPGRKSLIFLTSGFPLSPERQSELTAVIDACNKANVAIYPIDVRGLVAGTPGIGAQLKAPGDAPSGSSQLSGKVWREPRALVRSATFHPQGTGTTGAGPVHLVYVQHGGGGGGGVGGGGGGHGGGGGAGGGGGTGGGGGGKGGSGGGTGTGGGSGRGGTGGGTSGGTGPGVYNSALFNPYNQPRQIIPPFPPNVSDNQQLLYQLADGTGGFVIVNSNDLLGGMQRIANDTSHYYTLGYTPPSSNEGSCHVLKVKIDRGGTIVRSRSGYCNVRPVDLLAGKPIEKELEGRANGSQAGSVGLTMTTPYFYTGPNVARVDLSMEITPTAIRFEKQKGKQHAELNVLGIATKADGSVAARFSDNVVLDLDDKKEVEQFNQHPFRYENQFNIGCGVYTLKVVVSSGGENFGKLEAPLDVEHYNGKQFGISAIALSKDFRRVTDMAEGLDSELLADRTPLVANGLQLIPVGVNRFSKTDHAAVYVEIYDPLLATAKVPKVGFKYALIDKKTNTAKFNTDVSDASAAIRTGNPVVPIALKLPLETLEPGSYRVQLLARDSEGNAASPRTVDFEVQ